MVPIAAAQPEGKLDLRAWNRHLTSFVAISLVSTRRARPKLGSIVVPQVQVPRRRPEGDAKEGNEWSRRHAPDQIGHERCHPDDRRPGDARDHDGTALEVGRHVFHVPEIVARRRRSLRPVVQSSSRSRYAPHGLTLPLSGQGRSDENMLGARGRAR